ncbi:hypothetical protein HRbin02_01946 [Candidatus Calditenuaceae archaeon HR02]|nr:hypothetical protein HRbin02_01946 [Candidatus Calditenuaceae archaeon HR02]
MTVDSLELLEHHRELGMKDYAQEVKALDSFLTPTRHVIKP